MYWAKKNSLIERLQSASDRAERSGRLDEAGIVAMIDALIALFDECVESECDE